MDGSAGQARWIGHGFRCDPPVRGGGGERCDEAFELGEPAIGLRVDRGRFIERKDRAGVKEVERLPPSLPSGRRSGVVVHCRSEEIGEAGLAVGNSSRELCGVQLNAELRVSVQIRRHRFSARGRRGSARYRRWDALRRSSRATHHSSSGRFGSPSVSGSRRRAPTETRPRNKE